MALRFRRTFRVLPGMKVNVSRGGVSASFGIRGLGLTVGPRGVYGNVGVPGTGLSYRARLDSGTCRGIAAQQREEALLAAMEEAIRRDDEMHVQRAAARRSRAVWIIGAVAALGWCNALSMLPAWMALGTTVLLWCAWRRARARSLAALR